MSRVVDVAITTASRNAECYLTLQNMFLSARYNIIGDAPVDIDSLYDLRLVNFARD